MPAPNRILLGLISVLLTVLFWCGQSWLSAASTRETNVETRVTELEKRFERIDAKLDTLLEAAKRRK